MPAAVLGVDACKGGWVGVVIKDEQVGAVFAASIGGLAAEAGPVDGIAIDIPIGLLEEGIRMADVRAKLLVGPMYNSVFLTPIRAALCAATHAEATRISVERTGKGISQQSWALRDKIFEVEAWLPEYPGRVWEIHPEVSFAEMACGHLNYRKKSWAGARERCCLLREAGIELGGVSGEATLKARVDDMLDAAAAAWSAQRLAAGIGRSYPDPPEKNDAGQDMAIWA